MGRRKFLGLAAAGLAESVSEATRKVKEGAVTVNGEKCRDPQQSFAVGDGTELLIKVGRHFKKIVAQ